MKSWEGKEEMISKTEISYFLSLFIRNGYVLDFSTNSFDIFTTSSIEIPLCEKYELSKGKSLSAFCNDDSPEKVQKLLFDLLDYYETHYKYRISEEKNRGIFEKCLSIREREQKNIKIEVPALTCVNVEYISNILKRAIYDIENGEFDSAITKARTLLEEVFCNVIEEKNETPSTSGNIKELYKQVKSLYNMHQDKDNDVRINTLLSGFEKILTSISEMRNNVSDSHGVGQKRLSIKDYHARLYVNSAITMAEFILSVKNNALGEKYNGISSY